MRGPWQSLDHTFVDYFRHCQQCRQIFPVEVLGMVEVSNEEWRAVLDGMTLRGENHEGVPTENSIYMCRECAVGEGLLW